MRARAHPRRGRSKDALDLLGEEGDLLRPLFKGWSRTASHQDTPEQAVRDNWDHGTIGKMLLEHAAVRFAARGYVAGALRASGQAQVAGQLEKNADAVRSLLDRLDENSHGIQPMALAVTPGFVEAVEALRDVLGPELEAETGERTVARLAAALSTGRANLPTAKFVAKHAPFHPGPTRWYDRFAPVVRVHTIVDRLRGFPGAHSSLADTELADRYGRDR
ncbi:MAG: hypothetical protein ACREC5_08265 [Thermoplasmata archaeon]